MFKSLANRYKSIVFDLSHGGHKSPGCVREIFQSLHMRTQGRLVKFPQSNLRFSHRLSTYKELLYISDGDCNGVFYFIGTSFGVHRWMNPVLTKVP